MTLGERSVRRRNAPLPEPFVRLELFENTRKKVMCKIIWHLDLNQTHAKVFGYQILYSLGKVWHLLGTVIAQPLPMSCYVVGMTANCTYRFVVRAVDEYDCTGLFSSPQAVYVPY